jgi:hypothetical protein
VSDLTKGLALAALGFSLLNAGPSAARPHAASPAVARPGDLSGTWTNAWYTKLERPKEFNGPIATPAEAAAYEAPRRALHGEISPKEDVLGQNESEFPDNGPGMARVHGELRSSWIIDPSDGHIPWIPEAKTRLRMGLPPAETYDNVENRDTDERCLTAGGSGVPMLNAHDANLIQLVQTPGWLAIVMEKNHETRYVRMTRPGSSPSDAGTDPGQTPWLGTSTGHWEGKTLVVETKGFRRGITDMSRALKLSDHARVTERFTRTSPKEILYAFEVTDETLFTRPWRAEMVFRPAEGLLYEYACHEGNYSLPTILHAARLADSAPKTAGASK